MLSETLHNIVLTGGLRVEMTADERRGSVEDHEAIYERLHARDPEGAAVRTHEHLDRSLYLRDLFLARSRPTRSADPEHGTPNTSLITTPGITTP